MSVTWVVRFCTHCSRAFDVPDNGAPNKARVCDECRRDIRRQNQQRWYQRKQQRLS